MTSKPDILITDFVPQRFSDELAEKLKKSMPGTTVCCAASPVETHNQITDVEVVVTFGWSSNYLDLAEDLRWVHSLTSGVDHYPLDTLEKQGIVLTNSAGVSSEALAEHVLCFMLMFERSVHKTIPQQTQSVWQSVDGGELHGKTIGIIGVGASGARLAQLCSALGMTVLGTKRDLSNVPDAVDEIYSADDYYEVLPHSDYVAVTCSLTEDTKGLIGSKELRAMHDEAVLINISRGEIIDEGSLVLALQEKIIKGAGLDVFQTEPLPQDSPLWDLSNVVITPHMAGSSPYAIDRWHRLISENHSMMTDGLMEGLKNRIV